MPRVGFVINNINNFSLILSPQIMPGVEMMGSILGYSQC
jgi:hypothetical protein